MALTGDTTARLVASVRRRLRLTTLVVLAVLVVGLGAATIVVAIRTLDDSVDQALGAAVDGELAELDGEIPEPSGEEGAERRPHASDTFFLFLGPDGGLVADPSGDALAGLPDRAAVDAARATGSDLRTVSAGGRRVRLLTRPIVHEGSLVGWLQAVFVLDLRDSAAASLVTVIGIVGLAGLVAAALATLYLTGRALVPIRAAFATERRFVADASHEIRTPAAIIRASAELLDREGHVDPAGKALVDDLIAEADRLGRLVEDLLALASAERSGLRLERQPIDLAAIAADTVGRARPLAAELGLVLVGPGRATSPAPTTGDPDRLVQLLLVLVDNACRHSPAGGTITVAVRVDPAARLALAAVDDQGPGVPEAMREAIFEPFARISGARERADAGSGLGLAIARRIAALHGGTLTVGEAPGGGARFVLGLPLR